MDVEERRARLAARHRLLPGTRTDDVAAIADSVVALHSSDPVTVFLSALARMCRPSIDSVERALYVDRSLIRHHAMRRTLWVATPETVRLMHAAATRNLVAPEERRTAKLLAASGITDPEAWLEDARAQVLADLHRHGPSTARELGERVSALRHPLQLAPGKSWGTIQGAHTRVLTLLGFEGAVLRTRPSSWLNGAYRYAAADTWLPGGLGEMDPREAAAKLLDRYLRCFGPATTEDVRWWMGWTVAVTRQALRDSAAVRINLDGVTGWIAADDQPVPPAQPWVALLPSLDPTTMGWKERDFYLPPAAADAFDRNGNAGPTIWVDGRVVGAWAQSRDGEIAVHYFGPVPPARRREVAERVAEIGSMIGSARFTVRFPGTVDARLRAPTTATE